jgi:hypothetical protein
MTKDEALKLALEALIGARAFLESDAPVEIWGVNDQAITAIKEALANDALEKKAENARELGLDYEPEQEPVAYVKTVIEALYENSDPVSVEAAELLERITTPPQHKPLTDEEIDALREANSEGRGAGWRFNFKGFARAIEAAHGISGEKPNAA